MGSLNFEKANFMGRVLLEQQGVSDPDKDTTSSIKLSSHTAVAPRFLCQQKA